MSASPISSNPHYGGPYGGNPIDFTKDEDEERRSAVGPGLVTRHSTNHGTSQPTMTP